MSEREKDIRIELGDTNNNNEIGLRFDSGKCPLCWEGLGFRDERRRWIIILLELGIGAV